MMIKFICLFAAISLALTGCVVTSPMERVEYSERWKDGKYPDSTTLMECNQYASGKADSAAPPVALEKTSYPAPTDCSRQTGIAKGICETGNRMARQYAESGTAIGNSIAQGNRRRRWEAAYEEGLDFCYGLEGFKKERIGNVTVSMSDAPCADAVRTPVTSNRHELLTISNRSSADLNIVYWAPEGKKVSVGEIESRETSDFAFFAGSSLLIERLPDGVCMASLSVPDYEAETTVILLD